jgi:outer membrane protein assembly factor BamB
MKGVSRVARAVPFAALVSIVVAAATVRVARRTPTSPPERAPHVTSATSIASPSNSIDAKLTGPTPPPRAYVPDGAPRAIHGGARHVHRSAARGPATVKVGWRVELGAPISAQVTASLDEQTLYAATLGGDLVALARADGATRWSVALGDRVYSTPLVADDGTVYAGSDARKLFAISAAGTVAWKIDLDGEADSGAVFAKDGKVVFAAGSQVIAVRRGGDVAWRFTAKGKVFTAPAITDEGMVVFGSQDDHVYALREGGALAWAVDLGADVDGAPVIGDDGAIFVGTDKGEVVRLDPQGNVVWRTNAGGFVRGVLALARNGDVLAGTYGPVPRMVRIGPDGAIRGAFAIRGTGAKEFGIHGGALEDADGTLFFGAQDDAVYALAADAAVRFRHATKADVDAPLTLLADGSLVAPSEDGSVTLLLR